MVYARLRAPPLHATGVTAAATAAAWVPALPPACGERPVEAKPADAPAAASPMASVPTTTERRARRMRFDMVTPSGTRAARRKPYGRTEEVSRAGDRGCSRSPVEHHQGTTRRRRPSTARVGGCP